MIQLMSSMIQLMSSMIQLMSSMIQLMSSMIQLMSSMIQLMSSMIQFVTFRDVMLAILGFVSVRQLSLPHLNRYMVRFMCGKVFAAPAPAHAAAHTETPLLD